MKKTFVLGGCRFLGVTIVSLGLATVANMGDWFAYWEGTIRRVQTVDFNILSHTLPTKLSYLLIHKDYQELQKTINSNYGLFGIVITDCKLKTSVCADQKILYSTESNAKWKQKLSLSNLTESSYNLLYNPPPRYSEGGFWGPHDERWVASEKANSGEIIGRVYYVRGVPPTFVEDYVRWLKNPLSQSGAHKDYAITTQLFLSSSWLFWLLIEILLYWKRLQKYKAQRENQKLQEDARRFQDLLKAQIEETSRAVQQRENLASELVKIQNDYQNQEKLLQGEIQDLEQRLVDQQHQQQVSTSQLLELQNALDATRIAAEEEISQKQSELEVLQQRIEIYQQEEQKKLQALEQSRQDLLIAHRNQAELQAQFQNHEQAIVRLRLEIESHERLEQENNQVLEYLNQQLAAAEAGQITAREQLQKQSDDISALIREISIQEQEKQEQEKTVTDLQQKLSLLQEVKIAATNQLQAQEQAIESLQQQIEVQERKTHETTLVLQHRNQDLQEARARIDETQRNLTAIEQKNIELRNERDEALQKIQDLESRLYNSLNNKNLLQALEDARAEAERLASHSKGAEDGYLEIAQQLENRNRDLVKERDDLQYQLWELQERIELYETSQKSYEKVLPSLKPIQREVDLSCLSFAIVGGYSRTRREVIRELCSSYNLKDYQEISPSSEEHIDSRTLKIRLKGCGFIVVLTKYIGHDLTNMISNLRKAGAISGKVIMVNSRGKTGILREVLTYIAKR